MIHHKGKQMHEKFKKPCIFSIMRISSEYQQLKVTNNLQFRYKHRYDAYRKEINEV